MAFFQQFRQLKWRIFTSRPQFFFRKPCTLVHPCRNAGEKEGFRAGPVSIAGTPRGLSLNAPGGWLAIGFGRFTCAAEVLIFASRTRPAADGPGRGPGGSPPRAGRGCRRAGSAPARGKAGPAALRGSPPGRTLGVCPHWVRSLSLLGCLQKKLQSCNFSWPEKWHCCNFS